MKNWEHRSRSGKVRPLEGLQSGNRALQKVRPWTVEFLHQHDHARERFISEKTGGVITAAGMQEKQQHKGNDVLFIYPIN